MHVRGIRLLRACTWEAHVSQPADGSKKVHMHLSAFCVHRHPEEGYPLTDDVSRCLKATLSPNRCLSMRSLYRLLTVPLYGF